MSRARSNNVTGRNVKLDLDTYGRLDKFLMELILEREERKLTLNDAVSALLDEHLKQKQKVKKQ